MKEGAMEKLDVNILRQLERSPSLHCSLGIFFPLAI
jgi:hypothetical protein